VNEFSDLWVVQVFLRTKSTFPTIRKREIVEEKKENLISPFQNAILNLKEKTNDIKRIIAQTKDTASSGSPDMGPLSMILNGVIDAAVQGGVKKYREAFFTGSYLQENPQDEVYVSQFHMVMRDQVAQLRKGLELFDRFCNPKLRPLYNHLMELFETMANQQQSLLDEELSKETHPS
jgi:hypothetical protein